MTTCAFEHFAETFGRASDRRTALQALGASALAAGAGLAGLNGVAARKGKGGKKGKKKGGQGAAQDLVACQDVILSRCLIGDTVCIASGNQCCTQLATGQTADAVRCLINFQPGRVQL